MPSSNRNIKDFFRPVGARNLDIQDDSEDAVQTATTSHVGQAEDEEANTPLASSLSLGVFNLPSYLDIGALIDYELKNENIRIKLLQEARPDCQKL